MAELGQARLIRQQQSANAHMANFQRSQLGHVSLLARVYFAIAEYLRPTSRVCLVYQAMTWPAPTNLMGGSDSPVNPKVNPVPRNAYLVGMQFMRP